MVYSGLGRTLELSTFHFDTTSSVFSLTQNSFVHTRVQIAEVKAEIETSQGEDLFPKDVTNVIYQGKILKDDATLQDSSVTEQGFCVVMAMKVGTRVFVSAIYRLCCLFDCNSKLPYMYTYE